MTRPPHTWNVDTPPGETELAAAVAWILIGGRRNGPGQAAEPLPAVIRDGSWHRTMVSAAGRMRRQGFLEQAALAALVAENAGKYEGTIPPDSDAELAALVADVYERYEAAEEIPLARAYDGEPRPIDDVLEVFKRWLFLPDAGLVYVTCAAVAANRVPDFDPTWLIVVGPAGSAKTETLSATSRLDDVHVVGTLTEPSLLSGTPRKDTASDASGGLLREIGEHGIIVLKDFGSVLSMHREQRASVIAALRELYDGSWTRLLGVDGGRRLHWQGRLGLLAGATGVLDQHHGVMAQLGERFLLYRITVDDAAAMARSSLAHQGREREMRRELSDAVAGLFAGLDLSEPPALSEPDTDRLVALAVLVSRARSPVVRENYQREIDLVPPSEAPGRLVGALGRMLTGLRLIGVDDAEAWRVTTKVGLDSMPASRLRALEFLLGKPQPVPTTTVALELGLPTQTTRRVLEDLAAHGALLRTAQGDGRAHEWSVVDWIAELYRAATTVPEMSDTPFKNRISRKTTFRERSPETPREPASLCEIPAPADPSGARTRPRRSRRSMRRCTTSSSTPSTRTSERATLPREPTRQPRRLPEPHRPAPARARAPRRGRRLPRLPRARATRLQPAADPRRRLPRAARALDLRRRPRQAPLELVSE